MYFITALLLPLLHKWTNHYFIITSITSTLIRVDGSITSITSYIYGSNGSITASLLPIVNHYYCITSITSLMDKSLLHDYFHYFNINTGGLFYYFHYFIHFWK